MSTSGGAVKKVGFIGLSIVLLIVIISLVKSLLGYLKLDDRFLVAESEVEKLSDEKTKLENELYDEDEDYVIERELRGSLGLSKAGEVVVVLPDELVNKTIEERKSEELKEERLPNWKKWWVLFFDKK